METRLCLSPCPPCFGAKVFCQVGEQVFQLLVEVEDAGKIFAPGELLKDISDNLAKPTEVLSRESMEKTLSYAYDPQGR